MINRFRDEYRFLSNFWILDNPVELEGLEFKSVEHAYVASKTKDVNIRLLIQNIKRPGQCKRHGKGMKLRDDWEQVRLEIMEDLVRQKFYKNDDLFWKLIQTHPQRLIEGNTWDDTFWGQCNGVGQNHLGKILMKVRNESMRAIKGG